jgi:hypothetical protein
MNNKLFFIIIVIQIFFLFLINQYSNYLEHNKKCKDCLNKELFSLNFCLWNISHIIVFFIYCILFKPITFKDHIYIFMIGVIWFIMQFLFTKYYNKNKVSDCNDCIVYKNMQEPRFDDLIFNTFGQILYIVYIYFLTVNTSFYHNLC